MCPVKTETMSINVSREEATFWRKLAFSKGARSRGTLQKDLLLAGLEKMDLEAAEHLKKIRQRF
jgi:hypothetical protein